MKDPHLDEIVSLLRRTLATNNEAQARSRRAGYWDLTVRICGNDHDDGSVYTGSGLLISPQGHFVTNYHVIEKQKTNITVTFHAGLGEEVLHAPVDEVLCVHRGYDLALSRCTLPQSVSQWLRAMPKVVLASTPIEYEESLRVYGFKHEVVEERTGKVTRHYPANIFNCEKRDLVTWLSSVESESGFSGGPVVRAQTGELLGFTWGSITEQVLDMDTREHAFIETGAIRTFLETYVRAQQPVPPAPSPASSPVPAPKRSRFRTLFKNLFT